MQVKSEKSRILGSSDKIRGNQDRTRKDERSIGLAPSKRSQKHTKVFRTSQLLLAAHWRFYVYSQTVIWLGKEGLKVGLNRKTE